MTLIVGIRCTDGIVMGADGAATLGAMGAHTARQQTVRKLSIIQGKVIVGVAGFVGLAQRLRAAIDDGVKGGAFSGRAEAAVGKMRAKLWDEIVHREITAATTTAPLVGNHVAAGSAIATMMVALPLNGKAELVQFDQQCAPELASEDLPFVALGSGQGIADPFLAFIRQIFWPKALPPLNDGIFSAVWTLRHAIDTHPGGVADPIQIMVLERNSKNDWAARELPEAEREQHVEAVRDAERSLKAWRDNLSATPTTKSPEEPPPA